VSKVTVFASFVPKAGNEAKVEQILTGMVEPTRAESGCEQYNLYKSKDDQPTYHLFEIYEDQEALAFHRETAHYKAYRAEIPDYLAEPIGVKVLESL